MDKGSVYRRMIQPYPLLSLRNSGAVWLRDAIPGELSDNDWFSTTSGAQYLWNNDAAILANYGRLYNWLARFLREVVAKS